MPGVGSVRVDELSWCALVLRSTVLSCVSGNKRRPLPRRTGKIMIRYSSPRSCSISVCTTMLLDGAATRYSTSMRLTIDLSPAQAERLRQEAERLGLAPEELARAAITDLLATPDPEFARAADRVLRKNEELYRRLA